MKINKGDYVGRISYGSDILFIVDRIIKQVIRLFNKLKNKDEYSSIITRILNIIIIRYY